MGREYFLEGVGRRIMDDDLAVELDIAPGTALDRLRPAGDGYPGGARLRKTFEKEFRSDG
jgi:hypothetical protein